MKNKLLRLYRVALATIALIVLTRACITTAQAQQEYITCSNGTEVFHVAYPGMCPVGSWPI